MSKSKVNFKIKTTDPNIKVLLFNANFHEVEILFHNDNYEAELAKGVYLLRFERGGQFYEESVYIIEDDTYALKESNEPRFTSAVPLEVTINNDESQQKTAEQLSLSKAVEVGSSGALSNLMIYPRLYGQDSLLQLEILQMNGELVYDLSASAKKGVHLALMPGAYRLRFNANDDFIEQVIYTVSGWQTQVFILLKGTIHSVEKIESIGAKLDVSIMMARSHSGFNSKKRDSIWSESALKALSYGNTIPKSESSWLLSEKFDNPMLGIYAALLHFRRDKINTELMLEVFRNLYRLLGPIPDVLAIGHAILLKSEKAIGDSLGIYEAIIGSGPCDNPPMLKESWEYLIESSVEDETLIPFDSFASRVAQNTLSTVPWLIWKGEPEPLEKPSPKLSTAEGPKVKRPIFFDFTKRLPEIDKLLKFPDKSFEMLPNRIQKINIISKLKHSGVYLGSAFLMQKIEVALKETTDVHYRLNSFVYKNQELAVAKLINPKADPFLAQIGDETEIAGQIINEINKQEKVTSFQELTRLMRLPSATVLSYLASFYNKFVLLAVPPLKFQVDNFIERESGELKILSEILYRAIDSQTTIKHRFSKEPLNRMQFIYLRYQGRPNNYVLKKTIEEQDLKTWLTLANYTSSKGKEITLDLIKTEYSKTVTWLTNELSRQNVFSSFNKKALQNLISHPSEYELGQLVKYSTITELVGN